MSRPSTKRPGVSVEDGAFARSVGGFGAATLLSRILGYARDLAIMAVFGGGALTDTFVAAFRISNFFRRTLGEGALTPAFVPVLTREAERGPAAERRFMSSFWAALFLASAAASLLGMLAARPLVALLAPGFLHRPEQFELTVDLTRILFPTLIFIILAAAAQGALNVRGRFFTPALAPTMFSLALLGYMGALRLGWVDAPDARWRLYGLAAAATLGGFLQLALLVRPVWREGLGWSPGPLGHPGLGTVGLLMLPSLIGMAADQIGNMVSTVLASLLEEGSITAIYNSNRLMQLPLALFGVGAASVALPELAKHAGRDDPGAFRRTLSRSLRLSAYLLWPSTVGLVVISLPVTRLLYEHGRFDLQASLLTSAALSWSAVGIMAYAATKVLVTGFYARKDAATPVLLGTLSVAANAALAVLLMRPMRVAGLALAASAGAWLGAAALAWALHRRAPFLSFEGLLWPLLKSLGASLIMGAAVRAALPWVPPSPAAQVAAALALAVPLYWGLSELFDLEERHQVLDVLRRRRAPPADVQDPA